MGKSIPTQIEVAELKTKFMWLSMFIAYVVFLVLMWGFVPQGIASAPLAVRFAECMSGFIPMLNQIEKIPGYDPFIRFFYAVQWMLMPLATLYAWVRTKEINVKDRDTSKKLSTQYLIFGLALWLLCVLLMAMWPINISFISRRDKLLVNGIFGVGFFGLMKISVFIFIGVYIRRLQQRLARVT